MTISNSKAANIVNVVLFKLSWWSTVLFSDLAFFPVICIYVFHLLVIANFKKQELLFTLGIGLMGVLADSLFLNLDLFSFKNEISMGIQIVPISMISLWLAFASTLNFSFSALFKGPVVSFSLGALLGPFSYFMAARMGGLVIEAPWLQFSLALGIFWGLLFLGIYFLKIKFNQTKVF